MVKANPRVATTSNPLVMNIRRMDKAAKSADPMAIWMGGERGGVGVRVTVIDL